MVQNIFSRDLSSENRGLLRSGGGAERLSANDDDDAKLVVRSTAPAHKRVSHRTYLDTSTLHHIGRISSICVLCVASKIFCDYQLTNPFPFNMYHIRRKRRETVMPKNFESKSGWSVSIEKLFPSGMYLVELRNSVGDLHDKIRCDDYRLACDYFKSFKAIAKAN